jgi:hypothetical protein
MVVVRKNMKLYIVYAVPVIILLLVGVLFVRAKGVIDHQEEKISMNLAMGEFTNTFVTLPYIISRNMFGYGFTLEYQTRQIFEGFIPGFLKEILWKENTLGEEIAEHIGRGYGLANNFITELLYLYGLPGLFFIVFYIILFYYLDYKFVSDKYFIFKVICIFQLRLFVREGYTYITSTVYIILMYAFIPYLFSQKNLEIKRIFTPSQ